MKKYVAVVSIPVPEKTNAIIDEGEPVIEQPGGWYLHEKTGLRFHCSVVENMPNLFELVRPDERLYSLLSELEQEAIKSKNLVLAGKYAHIRSFASSVLLTRPQEKYKRVNFDEFMSDLLKGMRRCQAF